MGEGLGGQGGFKEPRHHREMRRQQSGPRREAGANLGETGREENVLRREVVVERREVWGAQGAQRGMAKERPRPWPRPHSGKGSTGQGLRGTLQVGELRPGEVQTWDSPSLSLLPTPQSAKGCRPTPLSPPLHGVHVASQGVRRAVWGCACSLPLMLRPACSRAGMYAEDQGPLSPQRRHFSYAGGLLCAGHRAGLPTWGNLS